MEERILPQYTIILEGENDALKQKLKELPAEATTGTHLDDQNFDRRIKAYREANPSVEAESHVAQFFVSLLGSDNCVIFENPEKTADV